MEGEVERGSEGRDEWGNGRGGRGVGAVQTDKTGEK